MTNPISRRKILGVAGTAAGSYAVSGILNGKVLAAPSEFCDFVWPMTGNVIQTSDVLEGIHVGNDIGTPIYASRAGEVKSRSRIPTTSEDQDDFLISINHENGYTTSYLPLRGIALEEGDTIEHSQLIGYLGDLESNEIVPGLFFDIRRNAESRPIPGHINEHVAAGEMISKDYAGIECPNGDPEPGPGPIFNDLKNQKIALAERIETISGGSIQEVDQVQAVIGNLETEATNGTISFQEAANAVRRLKLGEEVTERTLVGAGPATPDINGGEDYDIATETAETVIETGISIVFSLLPFGRIIKRIPFGDEIMKTAKKWGTKAFQWLLKGLLKIPNSQHIFGRTRKRINNASISLYDDIVRHGEEQASAIISKKTSQVNSISGPLAEDLLNEMEIGGDPIQRRGEVVRDPTDLSEALAALNQAADPAAGASFTGTLDDATLATEQGIEEANQIFESTMDSFNFYNGLIAFDQILNVILDILSSVGLLIGGSLSAIALALDFLRTILRAGVGLMKAGVGWEALADLRDNHAQTLDSITTGTAP